MAILTKPLLKPEEVLIYIYTKPICASGTCTNSLLDCASGTCTIGNCG